MQVEAKVVAQALVFKDVAQQSLVARPQQNHVVWDVVVDPLGAEIPDEEAH